MSIASRLSVRAQLTLWNVGVVALALTLFGFSLRFGVERVLTDSLDHRLQERTDRFQGRIHHEHEGGGSGGPPDGFGTPDGPPRQEMPPPPEQIRDGEPFGGQDFPRPPRREPRRPPPDPYPVVLLDGNTGNVLWASPGGKATAWSPENAHKAAQSQRAGFAVVEQEGQRLRVLSVPVANVMGNASGVIQAAVPFGEVDTAIGGVTRALLLVGPTALLIIAVGGLALADRALRPVGRLAEAAGRIQAGDLSARLPGDDAPDEFGRLTGVLNGMLARLHTAFERQRRFAADASHELRTPLATIKAHTSLALEDPDTLTPGEARVALVAIDRAADRAERLVRDLLLLVRVGALPVRPESVSLHDVLHEAARSSLAAVGTAPHAALSVEEGGEADPAVWTDRDHLLRLLGNLMENALRYTPPEGRVVVMLAAPTQSGVVITIADNGPGIAPEHLARLGEPFYRADAARNRKTGGAGLGLAISYGLAEALGGTLRLQSQVGKGTTATVTLPEQVSPSAALPPPLS